MFVAFLSASCAGAGRVSPDRLLELLVAKDCSASELSAAPLLLGIWRPGDTTWIARPGSATPAPGPEDAVQVGALTTAFLAEVILDSLASAPPGLSTVALQGASRDPAIAVTFADLLLHRSGVPAYDPGPPYPTDGVVVERLVAGIEEGEKTYRYDLYNYGLAFRALAGVLAGGLPPRPRRLNYSDRIDSAVVRKLARTSTPLRAGADDEPPRRSDLLAVASGGIATARDLLALAIRLDSADRSSWPHEAVERAPRPTEAVPGWHRIRVSKEHWAYLAAGQTRRYGAAVAYFPGGRTAVVTVAGAGRRLDCLAFAALRNATDGWRAAPGGEAR